MSIEIPITVIPVATDEILDNLNEFPVQALTDYFAALGYPLNIQVGGAIAPKDDPTDHPDEIPNFCKQHAPASGVFPWPGILLLTDASIDGSHVNGTLLDVSRRGACAVFTRSIDYGKNQNVRFEILVHEVGHMLNLSHEDGADKFPTAMLQSDLRRKVKDRSAIWQKAIFHGSQLQRDYSNTYYNSEGSSHLGLPMSAQCCDWLDSSPQDLIIPWGGRFKDSSYAGSYDKSFSAIDCRISIDSFGVVAHPLDIQIEVSAKSIFKEVYTPSSIDLRSGNVEIHITSPSGIIRIYQCHSMTCCTSKQRLERGRTIRRNYTLLGDKNGLLFPSAGKYLIEVFIPAFGARSGPCEYNVKKATGAFAEKKFQDFLSADFPIESEINWRTVAEALKSPDISARMKAFLRSKFTARLNKPFMPLKELRQNAAARTQERDALLRVIRIRRTNPKSDNKLLKAIDDAEEIFRETDSSHPTIQYLDLVRCKISAAARHER